MANILSDNEDYLAAIECAEKALSLKSDEALIYNNLGTYYKRLGQLEKAEEYFKTAVELDGTCLTAKFNYAFFLKNKKRWDEAIALFEEVAASPPEGAEKDIWRKFIFT